MSKEIHNLRIIWEYSVKKKNLFLNAHVEIDAINVHYYTTMVIIPQNLKPITETGWDKLLIDLNSSSLEEAKYEKYINKAKVLIYADITKDMLKSMIQGPGLY